MSPLLADGPVWWARAKPGKIAVIFEGDELTYGQLGAWSDRIAHLLTERAVAAGDRIGILAGNGLEYCAAVVAMLKAGAVVVPMSTRLLPDEISVLATSSEPRLVITDADGRAGVDAAIAIGPSFDILDIAELTPLRDGPPAPFPPADVDPSSPAALIYTSGTTGLPKGVIYTHQSVLGFITEWALTEPGFKHEMRQLMVLPLGGAPGTIWGIVHVVVRGGTLILHRQFRPVDAIAALRDDGVTCMLGVPILYEQMAAQPEFADAAFPDWETGHVGGARVGDEMLRAYSAKGVLLRQIYGMTEAGGSATANLFSEALDGPEFCGIGNMFTRIKTVRDDGTECDPGEPGQILIKGPAVTPGYWGNPEATAETIVDGWIHTGDLGVLDERGFLKMVDRLKDLIITGGLNVAPAEIENIIAELPEVEEVAVVPAADEKFGETPAAIVRLRGEITEAAIVEHCNGRLADYKVPRYVVVIDEPLPRMASGKVAKRVLREQHPDIAGVHVRLR